MYEVIVGNIGSVYHGSSSEHAWEVYRTYVELSQQGSGRAAGEDVTLWNNDEIEASHTGHGQQGE